MRKTVFQTGSSDPRLKKWHKYTQVKKDTLKSITMHPMQCKPYSYWNTIVWVGLLQPLTTILHASKRVDGKTGTHLRVPLPQIGMSNAAAWMTRMQSRRRPLFGAAAANGSCKFARTKTHKQQKIICQAARSNIIQYPSELLLNFFFNICFMGCFSQYVEIWSCKSHPIIEAKSCSRMLS